MQYSTPVMKFRYSENKSVCASWNISSGLVSDSGMTSGPCSATAKVLAARSGRRLLGEPGQDVGEAGGALGVNLEEQRRIEQLEFQHGRRPIVQGDEVDPGVGGGTQPSLGRVECGPGRRELGRRGFERADLLELQQLRRGPMSRRRSGPLRTAWLNRPARKMRPPSPSASTAS